MSFASRSAQQAIRSASRRATRSAAQTVARKPAQAASYSLLARSAAGASKAPRAVAVQVRSSKVC
jgi:ketol-acid reductoisomerase